ncbi:MAG: ATP-dependent Clp protease proteolytic subunit [Synechococcaceae cyanobacterium RM1_1_27]|nr:ATP-dependent Clp protease proteolytic subunit [Synechococcaceae cyanobacterium SM2_3_2]NJO86392.1 ATP-dependent Clp protease proteolytic subunit [Synechococcaceae cyanobacterium RM1_1_27]
MDLQAVQSAYYSGGQPLRTPPPDLPSLLLQERIIYLGLPLAEVAEANVTKLITAQLLYLQYEDREKPIKMYINSTGTYSYDTAAFAILDTMNYIKPPVHTICIGNAIGMSAMLLAAGAKGFRASLPNATIVLHQPYGGTRGQASDIEIRTREVLTVRTMMLEQLAQSTGQTIERIKKDTERFYFMTPAEAKEYGLIDQVLSGSQAVPPAALVAAGV